MQWYVQSRQNMKLNSTNHSISPLWQNNRKILYNIFSICLWVFPLRICFFYSHPIHHLYGNNMIRIKYRESGGEGGAMKQKRIRQIYVWIGVRIRNSSNGFGCGFIFLLCSEDEMMIYMMWCMKTTIQWLKSNCSKLTIKQYKKNVSNRRKEQQRQTNPTETKTWQIAICLTIMGRE